MIARWLGLPSAILLLAAILVLGGLGAAAFHPPAAALVHTLSGPRAGVDVLTPLVGALLALPLPARDPGYVVAHVGDGPAD